MKESKQMSGAEDDVKHVIRGLEAYRQSFEKDREFYLGLARGQQRPRMLWIGCSDSRVVPGQITGADPGELFVIRNIANIVPPAHSGDDSVGAAIEYCLVHLGVDDVVICGHTGCGGVKALGESLDPAREAHLKRWVEFARPAASYARATDLGAMVRANVLAQRDHLMTYDCVRAALDAGRLRVHCWLFDMEAGDILAHDDATGDWRSLSGGASPSAGGWLSRLLGSGEAAAQKAS
jgi:carbonic anhydrase